MVKLDPADARTPVLQWYDIKRSSQQGGELLAAFELFMASRQLVIIILPKSFDPVLHQVCFIL